GGDAHAGTSVPRASLLRLDSGQYRLSGGVSRGAPAGEHGGDQDEGHEARGGGIGEMKVEVVPQEIAIVDVEPDPRGHDAEEDAEQRSQGADGGRLDHHRAPHGALVGADDAPERDPAPALPQIRRQRAEDAGEGHDDDEQLDGDGEGVRLVDLVRQIVDAFLEGLDLQTVAVAEGVDDETPDRIPRRARLEENEDPIHGGLAPVG